MLVCFLLMILAVGLNCLFVVSSCFLSSLLLQFVAVINEWVGCGCVWEVCLVVSKKKELWGEIGLIALF